MAWGCGYGGEPRAHLHHGAGEAVQHKPGAALGPLDVLLNQANHNLVRHQRACRWGQHGHATARRQGAQVQPWQPMWSGGAARRFLAMLGHTFMPLGPDACYQPSFCRIAPASIAFLASRPSGVFAATAARSMSPVARWHKQLSFLIAGLWVPLPEPGGPGKRESDQSAVACGVFSSTVNDRRVQHLHCNLHEPVVL